MVNSNSNPVANLTEYELRHLASHLEEAGRVEDLHRLLQLEWTPKEEVSSIEHKFTDWLERLRGQQHLRYENAWYGVRTT